MERNWKRFCINCRKLYRELFDTEYYKRKTYEKRSEEIINEIMAEKNILIRLKMSERIFKQIKERTILHLEENNKNNQIVILEKEEDFKKNIQLIDKIKQNENNTSTC